MKTPDQLIGELVTYGVGAIIIVAVLWWAGDSIVDAIQAPRVLERDRAIAANVSYKADNQRLVDQNTRFSDAMLERGRFEADVTTRLRSIEQGLRAKKAADPAVKTWAETEIPAAVLQ